MSRLIFPDYERANAKIRLTIDGRSNPTMESGLGQHTRPLLNTRLDDVAIYRFDSSKLRFCEQAGRRLNGDMTQG